MELNQEETGSMRKRMHISATMQAAFTAVMCIAATALMLSGCQKEPAAEPETTLETGSQAQTTAAPVQETTQAATQAATSEEEKQSAGKGKGRYSFITIPDYEFTEENFPYMDGSTASVPLGKAITECLLGVDEEKAANLCQFNRTTQSFRNLMDGSKDILVVGEPNASVFTEMKESGFGYELEEIATDALVFVVNESNPVDSLTTQQIRDIYSGEITNWKEVGGEDAAIIAFQRNEGAGSQALIKKLIMKDTPMTEAPTEFSIGSMGDLMVAVKNYDNSANAIGYSVYYYANDMKMAKGLKILKVDGVEPSDETIRNRKYPHLNAYYCVIPSKPETPDENSVKRSEAARVIYEWLGTQDGQELIASLGYVSVKTPKLSENRKEELTELITTWNGAKPGQLGELKAGTGYGKLIPYVGDRMIESDESGYTYMSGSLYGFLNDQGQMVTDPVYSDINQLSYYDTTMPEGRLVYIPMYAAAGRLKAKETEDAAGETEEADAAETDEYEEPFVSSTFRLISQNGSYVSEREYESLSGYEDGVLCLEKWDSDGMEYRGFDGKLLFTDQEIRESVSKDLGKEAAEQINWSCFRSEGGYYMVLIRDNYYLIDRKTMELKDGGYSSVEPVWNGMIKATAAVEDGQDIWYRSLLLDQKLNVLIPADYSDLIVLDNENILALKPDEQAADLYDKNGKLLRKIDGISYAYRTVYGFSAQLESGNTYIEASYTNDGDLLHMAPGDVTELSPREFSVLALKGKKTDGKAFVYQEEGSGLLLYQLETGATKQLDQYVYMYPMYTGESAAQLPYMIASYSEETATEYHQHFALIDNDLNTVYEGTGYIQAQLDPVENTWYLIHYYEDNSAAVMNDQLKVIAENVRGDISICGGMLVTVQDQITEARKIGGDICFRCLHNSAGED